MKYTRQTLRWLLVLMASIGTLVNIAGWQMHPTTLSHMTTVAGNSLPPGPGAVSHA